MKLISTIVLTSGVASLALSAPIPASQGIIDSHLLTRSPGPVSEALFGGVKRLSLTDMFRSDKFGGTPNDGLLKVSKTGAAQEHIDLSGTVEWMKGTSPPSTSPMKTANQQPYASNPMLLELVKPALPEKSKSKRVQTDFNIFGHVIVRSKPEGRSLTRSKSDFAVAELSAMKGGAKLSHSASTRA